MKSHNWTFKIPSQSYYLIQNKLELFRQKYSPPCSNFQGTLAYVELWRKKYMARVISKTGTAEQLWDWRRERWVISDSIFGGLKTLFLANSNFKNIGGGYVFSPPPTPPPPIPAPICPVKQVPTSQFSNGTHEFLKLVLARMALLMDQGRSVLPLQSAKAFGFGELWREEISAIFVILFCSRCAKVLG